MFLFTNADFNKPDKKSFYLQVYQSYAKIMYHQAKQIVSIPEDIEDVIQDAFVRLLRRYEKLCTMSEAHLAAYVALTVKSAAIDCVRRQDRTYYCIETEEIPSSNTLEQEIEWREMHILRIRAVENLPEAQRDLLLYKYVLEKTNHELAIMYNTTETNIRQMLCRTRRKLCRLLEGLE